MNILIIDDNKSLVKGLATYLTQEGHLTRTAFCLKEAWSQMAQHRLDLVITDLKLPDGSGIEAVKRARELPAPPPEVILMTAFGNVETAVQAMKLGAMDYLTKPVPMEEFAFRVNRVSKIRLASQQAETLQRAHETLLEQIGLQSPLDELVGSSPGISQVKELIRKAAPFPSTVLITGETGTGKEMVARAIHDLSPWSGGPFVRVNCASIPESLFESELFGHEKGAFTDARERRIGRFEAAQGGTLFLDEVGEVPLNLQAKLLRALQDKEIMRVGGTTPIIVETRIVAATNRALEEMAGQGRFREDLLYRLAVIRIHLPALRERSADIPAIVTRLLEKIRTDFGKPGLDIAPESLGMMMQSHSWPGNVRELKNALERAAVMSSGNLLSPDTFGFSHRLPASEQPRVPRSASGSEPPPARGQAPGRAQRQTSPESSVAPRIDISEADHAVTVSPNEPAGSSGLSSAPEAGLVATLEKLEREMIARALERAGGVKSRAAEELQIPRTNLLYRMKRLGLITGNEEPDGEK